MASGTFFSKLFSSCRVGAGQQSQNRLRALIGWRGSGAGGGSAEGRLVTPWGHGTWGLVRSRADVLVAEFAQQLHMLLFTACARGGGGC